MYTCTCIVVSLAFVFTLYRVQIEFIEGVSQFSVEGDRDKKLKCKSSTVVHCRGPSVACGIFRIHVLVGLVESVENLWFLHQLGLYIL